MQHRCTYTLSPVGLPLGPNPGASALALCDSVSAASGALRTPADLEAEGSPSCPPLVERAPRRPGVVQEMDVHWQQGPGASGRSLDLHRPELLTQNIVTIIVR